MIIIEDFSHRTSQKVKKKKACLLAHFIEETQTSALLHRNMFSYHLSVTGIKDEIFMNKSFDIIMNFTKPKTTTLGNISSRLKKKK